MQAIVTYITALLLMALPPLLSASETFEVGVATHYSNPGKQANLEQANRQLVQAGVTAMRADMFWSVAEQTRGQLAVVPSWRRYEQAAQQSNLNMMLILGYGNQFYASDAKPRTPQVRAAYQRYVDLITRTFGNHVSYYEIWNEWDSEAPGDVSLAQDYATLIKETAPIIRKRAPQALIIAGAVTTSGIKKGFIEHLIKENILQKIDGISLHPYVHCEGYTRNTPEGWLVWLKHIDKQITRKAGQAVPLYITEMGWPSHNGSCGIDEKQQAAYLARAYLLARTLPNIKGMWWYDYSNDGTSTNEQEHNFGLVNFDFSPKPAFHALTAITPVVTGYSFLERIVTSDPKVWLLRFSKPGGEVVAAWSNREGRSIAIKPSEAAMQIADIASADHGHIEKHTCPDRCGERLELSTYPKLIYSSGPVEVSVHR
ncbi:cellulase family glycosylhydrolase [Pseudomonas luteola]|uniref:cellulase family glycosylhydrolase n=1 Tax=Pseudomonas luteola TaxID=47886 RepID=UPI000F79B9D6|nr:cellulase family glycosylhydrolase [Pseudomonas luteola]